jgi:hypothetical protein
VSIREIRVSPLFNIGCRPRLPEKRLIFRVGKKDFFVRPKNTEFLKREKPAFPLVETRIFSQRFIKQQNRVKPTVGFIFR